jgi:hypothetical protein
MADITHLFLRRHLGSGPTAWTRHSVGGRVRHEGVGLSYAFRARTAGISEVPVEDRELSSVAHARTADQAEVSLPMGLTWRVVEPGPAAQRLDFGIDTRTGRWRSTPLDALATPCWGSWPRSRCRPCWRAPRWRRRSAVGRSRCGARSPRGWRATSGSPSWASPSWGFGCWPCGPRRT